MLESLADGAEVDWAALDSAAATSAERRRYRNLRLVARVAELHRTLTLDRDDVFPLLDADRADAGLDVAAAWGQLQVGERIGGGAYGDIYVAHDPQLRRNVALKVLRRGVATGHSLDQLLVEARTLAQVRHPNVVTIHGADVRDGGVGLWMELIHGQTLEAWLHAHGRMGAGEASAIGVDVCRALAAVHAAGLVHADVKAQNVMRENGGRLVLMDFGAGRAQAAAAVGVAGTPMYLAPEVLAGEPPTPRSDIYSVGVLLFHLVSGSYPWNAADLDGLRAAHANGERVWLRDLRPDLPTPLVDAIERALNPDPARRFASAGEMERALGSFSDVTVAPPAAALVRSRLFGFAAAAAVLLAVVAALVVWSRTTESRRGLVLADVRAIGVLPVRDLTDSGVPPHFVEGLTDELIAALGQVRGLTIKPAASPGREAQPLKDLARALDVDALLETTLTRGDDEGGVPRLKVRAKLIAGGSQKMIWSQAFDRPRGAALELPGAVASTIARVVDAGISPAETARLAAPQQTDPAAEEAYLQGLSHLDQYGAGDAQAALDAFNRALQRDPQHARAHVGAAEAQLLLGDAGVKSQARARTAALDAIRRALELNPDSAEAHAMLGYLRFDYDWDWADAEREFLKSLDVNPNYLFARVMYADSLSGRRRFDEAVAQAHTAMQLDPGSGAAARRYALILHYKRDFDGAERALVDAERIDPSNAGLPLLKGRFAEARGRFEDALAATTDALERAGGKSLGLRVQQVRQQALAGHRDLALAGLRELENEAAAGTIPLSSRNRAYMYLALGDTRKALDLFERAVDERDPTVVWLGVDPRLDGLQHEPRFRELLKVIGIPLQP